MAVVPLSGTRCEGSAVPSALQYPPQSSPSRRLSAPIDVHTRSKSAPREAASRDTWRRSPFSRPRKRIPSQAAGLTAELLLWCSTGQARQRHARVVRRPTLARGARCVQLSTACGRVWPFRASKGQQAGVRGHGQHASPGVLCLLRARQHLQHGELRVCAVQLRRGAGALERRRGWRLQAHAARASCLLSRSRAQRRSSRRWNRGVSRPTLAVGRASGDMYR